jgi:hypothetical protein
MRGVDTNEAKDTTGKKQKATENGTSFFQLQFFKHGQLRFFGDHDLKKRSRAKPKKRSY